MVDKVKTPSITVIGLGPGDPELLTLGAVRVLRGAGGDGRVFLRTGRHPSVPWLDEAGVAYETFDRLYEEKDTFEEVYAEIAERLIAEASGGSVEIVYAVPGHPTVAEASVQKLLRHPQIKSGAVAVRVWPAVSAVDAVEARLGVDPVAEGVMTVDAADAELLGKRAAEAARAGTGLLVMQIYDRMVASDAKLALMEAFDDETPVLVVRSAGTGAGGPERVEERPLFELDRVSWLDHLTSVYVPAPGQDARRRGIGELMEELADIMARLRSSSGCPWDRKQTHASLKRFLIEESYEVLDAVDSGVPAKLCEELGDVLLQAVFHAQLASEAGEFNIRDVIAGISEKLIRRHPHVFGDVKVAGAEEVVVNWEAIKKTEHAAERAAEEVGDEEGPSALDGIPRGLPALLFAQKTQEKAARVGFDWPEAGPVWEKLREEVEELRRAAAAKDPQRIQDELGDVLFSAVNLARFLGVDAEEGLRQTINKFRRRFRYVEESLAKAGLTPEEAGLAAMDRFWEEAKGRE